MYSTIQVKKFPPPWQLKGEGLMFVCRLSNDFIDKSVFLPEFLKNSYINSLAYIILLDYHITTVGPYKELLIIPGKFKLNRKTKHSITKIYVDSKESKHNGIHNWGIPKQMADFLCVKNKEFTNSIVSKNGHEFFNVSCTTFGPRFPVSSRLIPFRLVQQKDKQRFFTAPNIKAKARFARIINLQIANEFFPDFSNQKILRVFQLESFSMIFPEAEIIKL